MADWTVMVSLNAKNNLEPFSFTNFDQMAAVGSTDRVNLVLEYGRPLKPLGLQLHIGGLVKNITLPRNEEEMEPTESAALEDLGQVNMGDGAALADFVTWAKAKFPAKTHNAGDLGSWPGLAQKAGPHLAAE